MHLLLQDVRYAFRLLVKTPTFTAVALLTLALGIGATVAVFSVVNGLLLQPLPYPNADRLHMVWQDMSQRNGPQKEWMSPANYFDWRERATSFEDLSVYQFAPVGLTGDGEPEQLPAWRVTNSHFRVMGVQPALGRDFTAEDDRIGAPNIAIISHRLWMRRFGGDPGLVGRAIEINRESWTVVGIMPPTYESPFGAIDLWWPQRLNAAKPQRNSVFLQGIARRKADVPAAQAQAQLQTIADAIQREFPDAPQNVTIHLSTLHEEVVGDVQTPLLALLGAVALVLLIACANIANLLLARASTRGREMAVRVAVGASPTRLVRQLLTESVLLGGAGAVAGMLLSWWGLGLLVSMAPPGTPRLDNVHIDGTVLGFGIGLALLTSMIFGLAPVLQGLRTQVVEVLKEGGGKGSIGSRRALSARGLFIVAEMALALMLLVGAGLLMRSLANMVDVDPGFAPDHVLTARIGLPPQPYKEDDRVRQFYDTVIDRLQATPGVEAAGWISVLPFSGGDTDTNFAIEGAPPPADPQDEPVSWVRSVSYGAFRALRIRLEEGRSIEPTDTITSEGVVVINRTMANRYWEGKNPIGSRIVLGGRAAYRVVGIAADVHHRSLVEAPRVQMYLANPQLPRRGMTLVVRTTGDPQTFVPALRAAVAAGDPVLPVANITTLESLVAGSLAIPRLLSTLMVVFAGAALLLAAIGIYGLMAYSVSERTREFGIRSALGADTGDVLRLVLGQTARLTTVAVIVGTAAAFGVARLIGTLLFGVEPADATTFVTTAALLAAVSLAAGYLPARRATRVNPVVALRE